MAYSWTIVALPAEDDPVWKISSEKAPHLTILYLGEQPRDPAKESRVADYLEHISKTSLRRFGLSVDHRGELGDDKADVLFFDKDMAKEVAEARGQMLKSRDISEMYNSAFQYPSWTPHLTLGYPENPALKEPEYPISWVNFDRLALWVEDSDGPTFRLSSNYDIPQEVSMSDSVMDFLSHYTHHEDSEVNLEEYSDSPDARHIYEKQGFKEVSHPDYQNNQDDIWGGLTRMEYVVSEKVKHSDLDDFFAHYGIKGMKWGVRRTAAQLARARGSKEAPSEDYKTVSEYKSRAKAGGTKVLSNSEMQAVVNRMNLEQNYSRLNPSTISRGMSKTKALVGAVGTVSSVIALANSPAGQVTKTAFMKTPAGKAAKKAAKKVFTKS